MYTKRRFVKFAALFLLFEMLGSILAPTLSWALTTGPQQPEYTSFESGNTTDMVNLLSGDFNYSLPLLEVPGPEGGYNVPLFYHSFVSLEQEASWVGLGWNINAGAITRDIVGYPDDAFDQKHAVRTLDPGGSYWEKNYVLYKRTWDSNKGYGGGINLLNLVGADWDSEGLSTGTALGLQFNKDGINGHWAENVFNVANAAGTILKLSAASSLSKLPKAAAQKVKIAQSAATAVELGSLALTSKTTTTTNTYNSWLVESTQGIFKKKARYWLDETRNEYGFGTLYLGSTGDSRVRKCISCSDRDLDFVPRIMDEGVDFDDYERSPLFENNVDYKEAVASDMYTEILPGRRYSEQNRSVHIAMDNYSVMAPEISGNISPTRLDIGTLNYPKRMNLSSIRHNPVPFLKEDSPALSKVHFRYLGALSNSYTYHDSETMGINEYRSPLEEDDTTERGRGFYYHLYDDRLKDPDKRIAPERTGLVKDRLVHGKHIEWFTNNEILYRRYGQGQLMDYHRPLQRQQLPAKGIGAFAVTGEDGKTYHFALPVYGYDEFSLTGKRGEEQTKNATVHKPEKKAITWLLTAITGPDYKDRGPNGTANGLLDEHDRGSWVKFDYGMFCGDYAWRQPYRGYAEDGETSSYQSGLRETYYLNSIETRSHIALFSKGIRKDARGAYNDANNSNPMMPRSEQEHLSAGSSMYLDEIVLLKKEHYAELQHLGLSMENNTPAEYSAGGSCTLLANLWDIHDLRRSPELQDLLKAKSLKTVRFHYEEDTQRQLCRGTENAFEDPNQPPALSSPITGGGKLTLKGLSILGRNGVAPMPYYTFEYGNNPRYDRYKFDGWGAYNSQGRANIASHKASDRDSDGYAWSLTKITTPLGATLDIDYERDDYTSVAGEFAGREIMFGTEEIGEGWMDITPRNDFGLEVGDRMRLQGNLIDYCIYGTVYEPVDKEATVLSVDEERIRLQVDFPKFTCAGTTAPHFAAAYGGKTILLKGGKKGGNIRVRALTTTNTDGEKFKTRYLYTVDGLPGGLSSGVVAQEPEFIREADRDIYEYYDFPFTPVLYGKVTVLNGLLEDDTDYDTKTVYEFETPREDMVQEREVEGYTKDYRIADYRISFNDDIRFRSRFTKIDVRTAKIGAVKSIQLWKGSDHLVETRRFSYTENLPDQLGTYTTGSFLAEFNSDADSEASGGHGYQPQSFKLLKTLKTAHPYALESVTVERDGFETFTKNRDYDFLTGQVLKKENTLASGIRILSEYVPAHKIYPEMGHRSIDPEYRNMLGAEGARTTYLLDAEGNRQGLLSAGVQLWKKDWSNYREHRLLSGESYFQDSNMENYAVWRQYSDRQWEGDGTTARTAQGTFVLNDFHPFDFRRPSDNAGWYYSGEVTRYDYFSYPQEQIDREGIAASTQLDRASKQVMAEALNASYTDMAYSGAEYPPLQLGGQAYLSGEIRMDHAAQRTDRRAHTGRYSLLLSRPLEKGFHYRLDDGLRSAYDAKRDYRLLVWVNRAAEEGVEFYYDIEKTTGEVSSSGGAIVARAGDWSLMELRIPHSALRHGYIMELGVRTRADFQGQAYVDDFRFSPWESSMTCYVHDEFDALEYRLGDNHLYTRYALDAAGEQHRTYVETPDRTEKLVAEVDRKYALQGTRPLRASIVERGTDRYRAEVEGAEGPFLFSWYLNGTFVREELGNSPYSEQLAVENDICGYVLSCRIKDKTGRVGTVRKDTRGGPLMLDHSGLTVRIQGGIAPYDYRWTYRENGEMNPAKSYTTADSPHGSATYIHSTGSSCHELSCTVVDACGKEQQIEVSYAAQTLRVVEGSGWGGPYRVGDRNTFSVRVNEGCAPLRYTWALSKDGGEVLLPTEDTDGSTFRYRFDECGLYDLSCTVRDEHGGRVHIGRSLNVLPEDATGNNLDCFTGAGNGGR